MEGRVADGDSSAFHCYDGYGFWKSGGGSVLGKGDGMKVLWLCNIMLPAIGEALGKPYSNREGWLTGLYERICKEGMGVEGEGGEERGVKEGRIARGERFVREERNVREGKIAREEKIVKEGRFAEGEKVIGERRIVKAGMDASGERVVGGVGRKRMIELGICFPMEGVDAEASGQYGKERKFKLAGSGAVCYGFAENLAAPEVYDDRLEGRFREILEDFKPDVVHIFGTEFPHTLAMVRAFDRPERTLIGIQGLCFACADAYMADLPERVIHRRTFRDWLKKDSILQQQEKFWIRGEREKEALKKVLHITGRTEFDRRETGKINGEAEYHFMNETMRPSFYSGKWEAEGCVPYSIFLSQGDYPLKGFHYVLRALPEILGHYPEACVYVAGNRVIAHETVKDKIKLSSYGKYLLELIRTLGLEGHVKVLGRLSADEMKGQFLKSSVFICPSSLENSPNSLGEAMLLGVPAVAAATGGIPSMLEDGKEGFLYEAGNVKKLAECVLRTWEDREGTAQRAEAARARAFRAHDADRNFERLLAIYEEILQ